MISEREAVEYVGRLYRMEAARDCEKATLVIGPASAFVLIGALQLATRHPGMSDRQKQMLGTIIGQIKPLFAGTPGEELLNLGDYPEYDIPSACRYPSGEHAPGCPPGDHHGFGS